MVEEQWRHREKDLLNLLDQAQVRKSGECTDARDSEETRLGYVMKEVEDLRETVMSLSLEKETLLRQQSVANRSCNHAREEGSKEFGMHKHARVGKVVVNGRSTAIFRSEIGGADNVDDDVPLGVRSGGRGIEAGEHNGMAHGCFPEDARTAADNGEGGEGGDGIADKGLRHGDKEDKRYQNYRRCRRPRSGKEVYFVGIESIMGDKCHPDGEEDGELQAGTGNRCRIGVNATPTHAEDEEQLAPRNGPAPVPALLTPRHPRSRLMAAPSRLRF